MSGDMRFYSLPPARVPWPFLLVNATEGSSNNWRALRRRNFRHAILDPGVEYFLDHPDAEEYPEGFLKRYTRLALQLSNAFRQRLWVTIPDYMADYWPEGKQAAVAHDNIQRTQANIREFLKIPGVNWLPVIQSRYLDTLSFNESCWSTHQLIGDYPRVAIGTVCKTKNLEFIGNCASIARAWFKTSHIHAFGLTLRALSRVKRFSPDGGEERRLIDSWDSSIPHDQGRKMFRRRLIDSWDSAAHSYIPVHGGGRASTMKDREKFFLAYVDRIRRDVPLEQPAT